MPALAYSSNVRVYQLCHFYTWLDWWVTGFLSEGIYLNLEHNRQKVISLELILTQYCQNWWSWEASYFRMLYAQSDITVHSTLHPTYSPLFLYSWVRDTLLMSNDSLVRWTVSILFRPYILYRANLQGATYNLSNSGVPSLRSCQFSHLPRTWTKLFNDFSKY